MIKYYRNQQYNIGKLYKLTASYLKSPVYEILVDIDESKSHPFKSENGGFYNKAEPVCKTMLGEVKGSPNVIEIESIQDLASNADFDFRFSAYGGSMEDINKEGEAKLEVTSCTVFHTKTKQESKMKTVTHEGKVYQIGALYEFSGGNGCKSYIEILTDISNSDKPFIDEEGFGWKSLREIQNLTIGTIEDAPIELEDGAIYSFYVACFGESFGEYVSDRKSFFSNGNKVCGIGQATNIVKLVPEVKQ